MNTLLLFFIISTCNFNVELVYKQGIFQVGYFLNILSRYISTKGFIVVKKVYLSRIENNKCLTFICIALIVKHIFNKIKKMPKKIISCQHNLLLKSILLILWLYLITLFYSIHICIKILQFLSKIIINIFNIYYYNYNYTVLHLKSQEDYDNFNSKGFDLIKHFAFIGTINSMVIGTIHTLYYKELARSISNNLIS